MPGLMLLNHSFKFRGHLLICSCVHLNGVSNRGGGILKGQQGWRRRCWGGTNWIRKQFEAERNVFNLQCPVMERWREEKEEQRGATPLELLTLIHDLLPPRCETHMFGGGETPPCSPAESDNRTNPLLNIWLSSPSAGPTSLERTHTLCDHRVVNHEVWRRRSSGFSLTGQIKLKVF